MTDGSSAVSGCDSQINQHDQINLLNTEIKCEIKHMHSLCVNHEKAPYKLYLLCSYLVVKCL